MADNDTSIRHATATLTHKVPATEERDGGQANSCTAIQVLLLHKSGLVEVRAIRIFKEVQLRGGEEPFVELGLHQMPCVGVLLVTGVEPTDLLMDLHDTKAEDTTVDVSEGPKPRAKTR